MRPENLMPIYRKHTTIDTSGKETVTQAKYFVVDSVEALLKFGADAWERVVCVMTLARPNNSVLINGTNLDNYSTMVRFNYLITSQNLTGFFPVKGIYVSWSNDPPDTKITNWNVTELKVSCFYSS
jgi:parafibromin